MKLKTSKSASKRITKITKNGKMLRKGMSAQHRTKGKSNRAKRNAALDFELSSANVRVFKKLIPYR